MAYHVSFRYDDVLIYKIDLSLVHPINLDNILYLTQL